MASKITPAAKTASPKSETIADSAFIVADKAAASAEKAYAAASETLVEAVKPIAKAVADAPAKISTVAKAAIKTAKAAPAKPALVKAAKAVAPKIKAAKDTAAASTLQKGAKTMTDTVKNYAETAKAQFEAMFGNRFEDFGGKAKDMMAQGQKVAADVVEFSKGNLEAVVESGKITAKGVEVIARDSVDYGRKSVENTTAAIKSMVAVKSPTELMALNTELSKKAFDAAVAQASKQGELMLKLANDAFAPISGRFSVAMNAFKKAA